VTFTPSSGGGCVGGVASVQNTMLGGVGVPSSLDLTTPGMGSTAVYTMEANVSIPVGDALSVEPGVTLVSDYAGYSDMNQRGGSLIANGGTLTVHHGATVKFGDSCRGVYHCGIEVNGGTVDMSDGTASSPIALTSDSPTPAPGDWGGITMDSGTAAGVVLLNHVAVSYAGAPYGFFGGAAGFYIYDPRNGDGTSSVIDVENSSFSYGAGNGVEINRCDGGPTLNNDTFHDNVGYAVYTHCSPSGVSGLGNLGTLTAYSNGPDAPAQDITDTLHNTIYVPLNGDTTGAWAGFYGLPLFAEATGNVSVPSGQEWGVSGNTILQFDPGVALYVNGTLNMTGTTTQPISLTNVTGAGAWAGIAFRPGSAGALDHVHLSNAGNPALQDSRLYCCGSSNRSTGILVEGSSPSIEDTAIDSSSGYGVEVDNGGLPTLSNDTFTGNGSAAVRYDYTPSAGLNMTALQGSGNGGSGNVVDMQGGDIASGGALYVAGGGTLNMSGATGNLVTVDAVSGNSWQGIAFRPGSAGALDYIDVAHAGNGGLQDSRLYCCGSSNRATAILVESSPTISNTVIEHSGGYGIEAYNGGTPALSHVDFHDNGNVPLRYDYMPSTTLRDSGLTASGPNGGVGSVIDFAGGTLSGALTLDNPGLPVRTEGDVTVAAGAQLSLRHLASAAFYGNVTLNGPDTSTPAMPIMGGEFDADQSINTLRFGAGVYVYGTLTLTGAPAQQLVVTGTTPGSSWQGIAFRPGSIGTISNVDLVGAGAGALQDNALRCCGYSNRGTAVLVEGSSPVISDSVIEQSASYGLEVDNGGAPALSGDTFVNNTRAAVRYDVVPAISLVDNGLSAHGNGFDGISIPGGDIPSGGTLQVQNAGLPLRFDNRLTVDSGAQLSVGGAESLQFSVGGLYVDGSVNMTGTATLPITLTTSSATPAPGAWEGVNFLGGSSGVLDHVDIAYAGNGALQDGRFYCCGSSSQGGAILVESSPTIRDSTIEHSASQGIHVIDVGAGRGAPTLQNDTLANNVGVAVRYDFVPNATLSVGGLSASGNAGGDVIDLPGGAVGGGTLSMSNPGLPLRVEGDLTVNSDGADSFDKLPRIEFNNGAGFTVNNGGRFDVAGDGGTTTLTGVGGNPWRGVYYAAGGNGTLDYVTIDHATTGATVDNAALNLTLTHSMITDTVGNDVEVLNPNSGLHLNNDTFGPVSNGYYGVKNDAPPSSGACNPGNPSAPSAPAGSCVDATNSYWNDASGPATPDASPVISDTAGTTNIPNPDDNATGTGTAASKGVAFQPFGMTNGATPPAGTPRAADAPTNLDFGRVAVNGSSAAQSVTITNINMGTAPLVITTTAADDSADYTADTSCQGRHLGSTQTCTFTVRFTPGATVALNATLRIMDNSGGQQSEQDVALSGTGIAPQASVSPAGTLAFGAEPRGSSITRTLTISNNGDDGTTLAVSSVALDGGSAGTAAPADFVIGRDGCSGQSLARANGQSGACTVDVRFAPTGAGDRSARLVITDDAGGASAAQDVTLTGTGTTSTAAVTPASHDFGPLQAGLAATQAVTLTNSGAAPLTLGADATLASNDGGVYATATNGCTNGTVLDQSTPSCTVTVRFAPIGRGVFHGTLRFTDDAGGQAGSAQTVAFTGTGIAPDVRVDGPATQFGQVELGTTASRAITVTNDGDLGSTFTISSIGLDDTAAYTHTATCDGAILVADGANSCTFTVYFTPTTHGERDTTLSIVDNAGDAAATQGDQQQVGLTGFGTRPLASLEPAAGTTLDFGAVAPNTAATRAVTLTNSGDAILRTGDITVDGVNAGDFAPPQPNPCAGIALAPGARCSFNVTFTPAATGTRGATLHIADDAGAQPSVQDVMLQGIGASAASAALSPASPLDFGRLPVGTSATALVTITNTGASADLATGDISVTGAYSADYALPDTNPCAGIVIQAAGSCSFEVTFTPGGSGARPATLNVADDAGVQTLALTGTGVVPHAAVSPLTIAFSSTPLSRAVTRTVTITNTGDAGSSLVVFVDNTSIDDGTYGPAPFFTLARDGCVDGAGNAVGLAAGQSCSVDVRFQPASTGDYTATLRIADNSDGAGIAGSEQDVLLTGRSTTSAVVVSPPSYDFGQQPVGASVTRTVVVSNAGEAPLTLGADAALTPDSGGALTVPSNTNGCVSGTVLYQNDTCTVVVDFAPTSRGTVTGTLRLVDDNGEHAGSVQTVALTGTGVAPVAAVNPGDTLDFSTVLSGTASVKTVTISNVGDPGTTLTVAPLVDTTRTRAFTETDTCAQGVQAGSSCTVTVTFAPTARGLITSTLGIVTNSGNVSSTQAVALHGVGSAPEATLNPASGLDFTGVLSGTTATRLVTVTNSGDPGTTLHVGPVGVGGADASAFTQTTTCGSGGLSQGQSCTISVTFAPRARGAVGATLSVADDADGGAGAQALTVQGTGVAPEVGVSPANALDFSDVVSGTTATRTIVVSNTGDPGTTLDIGTITARSTPAGAFAQTNSCDGAALTAGSVGQTCTITVTFAPAQVGAQALTLGIPSDADAAPATLSYGVTGNGTAPHASISPVAQQLNGAGELGFGTVQVGQSVTRTVYITNTGSGVLSLTVTRLSLQGTTGPNLGGSPSGMFTIVSQTCLNQALAPGQGCAITLRFAASRPGRQSATLTLVDNSEAVPGSVQTVDLSGTGSRLTVVRNGANPRQVVVTGSGFTQGETVTILFNCSFSSCATPPAAQLGTTVTATTLPDGGIGFAVIRSLPSTALAGHTYPIAASGDQGAFALTSYTTPLR